MSISGVGGAFSPSYGGVRAVGASNAQGGGRQTASDVLAKLREAMPGWTISTSCADWSAGARNIQIDADVLERMARDPREMERVMGLMQEFENAVSGIEDWKAQNPGQTVEVGVSLAAGGAATALAAITMMGQTRSVSFDLPSDASWVEVILENLQALSQGEIGVINEAKSWNANA